MDRLKLMALEALRHDQAKLRDQIAQEESELERLRQSVRLELQVQLAHYKSIASELHKRLQEYDQEISDLESEHCLLEDALMDLQRTHMRELNNLTTEVRKVRRGKNGHPPQ